MPRPIVLDIAESNYTEWHCFFDAFISKFGLGSHLSSQPTSAQHQDLQWRMINQCLLRWFYNYISMDVLAIVCVPKSTARLATGQPAQGGRGRGPSWPRQAGRCH